MPRYCMMASPLSKLKYPKFMFLILILATMVALNDGDGELLYLRFFTVIEVSSTLGPFTCITINAKIKAMMHRTTNPARNYTKHLLLLARFSLSVSMM